MSINDVVIIIQVVVILLIFGLIVLSIMFGLLTLCDLIFRTDLIGKVEKLMFEYEEVN